jgi:hypothetical protein
MAERRVEKNCGCGVGNAEEPGQQYRGDGDFVEIWLELSRQQTNSAGAGESQQIELIINKVRLQTFHFEFTIGFPSVDVAFSRLTVLRSDR